MTTMIRRGFASDNNSGIHPELLSCIADANSGHTIAYGDDDYTRKAEHEFRENFGPSAEVFFVLTGTGANVLSLASLTRSYHSIICAETAHIHVDECGAPEKFTQCKLISVSTPDGKLTPENISGHLHGFGIEHHTQPRVISISQPTEMGTVYTPGEIKDIARLAGKNGMLLHMDGARLANAAVSLGLPFRDFTTDAGVDVLSSEEPRTACFSENQSFSSGPVWLKISGILENRECSFHRKCVLSARSSRPISNGKYGIRMQCKPIIWPGCWLKKPPLSKG